MISGSCDKTIHQYPIPDKVQAVKLQVSLNFSFISLNPYRLINFETTEWSTVTGYSASKTTAPLSTPPESLSERYDLRYRIDIYAGEPDKLSDTPCERYVTTMPVENENEIQPISFNLIPGTYTILTWVDYVNRGSREDLFYNTENLRNVTYTEKYYGNDDAKDAFTGILSFELEVPENGNSQDIRTVREIPLQRPLTKFHIVASDLEEYLQAGGDPTPYTTLSYSLWIPTAYDVAKQKIISYSQNKSFTAPAYPDEEGEFILASDYLFANEQEFSVLVDLRLHHLSGNIISRIPSVTIPLKRNGLTKISGKLLTTKFEDSEGTHIDDEFEDEIIITIP